MTIKPEVHNVIHSRDSPPPHSFIPGLKPSFSANSSHRRSLAFILRDWLQRFPGLFTDTSEHIRFYLLVFIFFHFLVVGSARQISRLMSAIERISYRIVPRPVLSRPRPPLPKPRSRPRPPWSGVEAPRDQDQDPRTTTPAVTTTQINPAVDRRHETGSLGHRVNGSFGSSFTSGSPGHRVIILTRCETRVFPVFEKMPKMQNVHLKCWNDKSHCQVSVVGLKSLDVSPCNELLLLPMIIKNSLAWEYFFARKSTFGVHYRTGSPGHLGLRVAGFPGLWVAGSQNVTQFHLRWTATATIQWGSVGSKLTVTCRNGWSWPLYWDHRSWSWSRQWQSWSSDHWSVMCVCDDHDRHGQDQDQLWFGLVE